MNQNDAQHDITQLAERWQRGDKQAQKDLGELVYPLLRKVARERMRSSGGQYTLGPTDLAHEAYVRLCAMTGIEIQSRTHYYSLAARVVRIFFVDYVRERNALKRGGDTPLVPLDFAIDSQDTSARYDWLALDQALERLESLDSLTAQVVELKYFTGLTTSEIAAQCQISDATVGHRWRFAKAWLSEQLAS